MAKVYSKVNWGTNTQVGFEPLDKMDVGIDTIDTKVSNLEVLSEYVELVSNSNKVVSAGQTVDFLQLSVNNSSRLTAQSGGVRIGAGVNRVKISVRIWAKHVSTVQTRVWLRMCINSDTNVLADYIEYIPAGANYSTPQLVNVVASVTENDLIYIRSNSDVTFTMNEDGSMGVYGSKMFVEVIG